VSEPLVVVGHGMAAVRLVDELTRCAHRAARQECIHRPRRRPRGAGRHFFGIEITNTTVTDMVKRTRLSHCGGHGDPR
jgi:hypothetical protein